MRDEGAHPPESLSLIPSTERRAQCVPHNVRVALAPNTPVQFIKGVGEGRAKVLQAAGLETVRDLLYFFPFRYEDRRHPTRVAEIGRNIDRSVLLRGRVVSAASRTSPVKRMK